MAYPWVDQGALWALQSLNYAEISRVVSRGVLVVREEVAFVGCGGFCLGRARAANGTYFFGHEFVVPVGALRTMELCRAIYV